jgi:hypothetical protein
MREIAALNAADDAAAREETARLAMHWPGFESVVLYEGERPVSVLGNPSPGSAVEPLEMRTRAA